MSQEAPHPELGRVIITRHFIQRLKQRFFLPTYKDAQLIAPDIITTSRVVSFHRKHPTVTMAMPGDQEILTIWGPCSNNHPVTGCYCDKCFLLTIGKKHPRQPYHALTIYSFPKDINLHQEQ